MPCQDQRTRRALRGPAGRGTLTWLVRIGHICCEVDDQRLAVLCRFEDAGGGLDTVDRDAEHGGGRAPFNWRWGGGGGGVTLSTEAAVHPSTGRGGRAQGGGMRGAWRES